MTPARQPDLDLLLSLYRTTTDPDKVSRPPWTWSTLLGAERAALARLLNEFTAHYNHTYATSEDDLIPPCWPNHPGLAYELATHLWLWYSAHLDSAATAAIAGDYYLRHLPGFRHRLTHLLGQSPAECRRGQHPRTWRKDADHALATAMSGVDPTDRNAISGLSLLNFGFTPIGSDQPT